MSEEAASIVGLKSLKDSYEQTSSSKWKLKLKDTSIHNKFIQIGGN